MLILAGAYTINAGGIIITASGTVLAIQIEQALVAAGIAAPIAFYLSRFATTVPARQSPFPPGPAELSVWRQVSYYRAWYIVNAARRWEKYGIEPGEGPEAVKELRYFQWHLRALDRRVYASALVDEVAEEMRPQPNGRVLLGWRAVIDARTTPDCRAANRKNFWADRPPAIGYPGSVHPRCRCTAVGPWPGAPILR